MAALGCSELLGVAVAREEGEISETRDILHLMLAVANREGVSFQGISPRGTGGR